MPKKYKKLARCRICGEMFEIDPDSKVYKQKYHAKHYCKSCYKKKIKKD